METVHDPNYPQNDWINLIQKDQELIWTRLEVCIQTTRKNRRHHTHVRTYVHSSINMQGYSIMHESPHH